MNKLSRAVLPESQHTVYRGEDMVEKKYDATYQVGNSTVHVVSPGALSEEETSYRKKQVRKAFINAWKSLSPEKQKEINEKAF